MSDATIAVSGLRKRFGATLALDGMSFTVQPGQVTGFVGPNGAGKSTTMRVILGLDAPDSGTALIGGRPYSSLRRPLSQVGALLDAGALQPGRSGRNHLLWLARSQGLPTRRTDEVIALVGLGSAIRWKAGGYSLGMRQRLGIAAALLGDPPVLLMDEPFNGMDPEGIVWMRGFSRSLAAEGRSVLVSSHLMGELEGTADHLVIVGRGRVIADTSVSELIAATSGDRVVLRTSARPSAVTALEQAGAVVRVGAGPDTLTVSGLPAEKVAALLGASAPAGRDGFAQLLWAEWTEFRTVRGWVIGMIVAGLLIVGVGLLSHGECGSRVGGSAVTGGPGCTSPLGPGGEG
jgi:ABC-2 type transport system ATP-binding protein